MLPIAVDAMGGDHAPDVVLAGVRRAVDDGIPVLLVGPPDLAHDSDIELIGASELIAMDEEPGAAVRSKKDSTLVRAAEAVRDGRASAMVSAGNTGATMAAALLRMGRIKGVKRPAIATPIPVPGGASPTVLLDAGANAEVQPDWLVQFAQMGSVYARTRFQIAEPRVGLLSIGEEPGKGDSLRKEAYPLLSAAGAINFIGNIEGRDVMSDTVDVAVTDGFTGNVTLKTLEGALKALIAALLARLRRGRLQGSCRRPAAGPRAVVQHAQPGHLRRGRAARSRRGVHHLSRLLRGDGDPQRHWRRCRDGRTRNGRRRSERSSDRRSAAWRAAGARRFVTIANQCLLTRPSNVTRSSGSSVTASPTFSRSTRRWSPKASRSSTTSMPTRWR